MNDIQKIAKKCGDLQKLLQKKGISQTAAATALGVTQASISNILNGKNKKPDKLPEIIDYLIGAYNDIQKNRTDQFSEDEAGRCEEIIYELESFPQYRKYKAKDKIGNARLPLSGQNKNYLLRSSDEELSHYASLPPTANLIVGGPKMGKTSTLNRIVEEVGDEKPVIWIDFSEPYYKDYHKEGPIDAFYRAFSRAVESQLPIKTGRFRINLEGASNLAPWMRDDILGNVANGLVLVIENLGRLSTPTLSDFLDALHSMVNQFFRNQHFRQMRLFVSLNSTEEDNRTGSVYESRFIYKCRTVLLRPFSHRSVSELVNALFNLSEGGEQRLAENAFKRFGGHPYLTHVYLETLRAKCKKEGDKLVLPPDDIFETEERNAFAECQQLFDDNVLTFLLKRLGEDQLQAFKEAYQNAGRTKNGNTGTVYSIKSYSQEWEDSGLFQTVTGTHFHALKPICTWIAERIYKRLS